MADIEKGINPDNFRWRAPVQNVDGSAITSALDYNLYRAETEAGLEGQTTPYFVVVGALVDQDPDTGADIYEAPIENFPEGRHVIALTAVDADGDESALSNTLGFEIDVVPQAPFLLA